MADPILWPSVLLPSSEDWSLRGGTRSGGQSFQGNEQVITSPTARWRASLNIPCWEPDQVRAMRRVLAYGRAQPWYIGPWEKDRAPWPMEPIVGGLITDQTPGITQTPLSFNLLQDAALNAPAISIQRVRGGLLAPGMIFSIGSRLHTIVGLTTDDPIDPGSGLAAPGGVGVMIRPWLRANYSAGTNIRFDVPTGTMRLATDDTGAMELQISRYGTVSLEFVEAF